MRDLKIVESAVQSKLLAVENIQRKPRKQSHLGGRRYPRKGMDNPGHCHLHHQPHRAKLREGTEVRPKRRLVRGAGAQP